MALAVSCEVSEMKSGPASVAGPGRLAERRRKPRAVFEMLICSTRRPPLRALAHALLHEFGMTRLPVRYAPFDGELLAFLE
jgi:hypothetical protein